MSSPNAEENGVAFTNGAVDVESGAASAPAEKDKVMSASEKAWDIDGDGKLGKTEKALKDMDVEGKGTLTKEQMLQLMRQNLAVQKQLGGVKKVVYALVGFTVILALANVGVSFAAAYLAKDTTVQEGKLTGKDGNTVATDTTRNAFEIDAEKDRERNEYGRELECALKDNGQMGNNHVSSAMNCEATVDDMDTHWLDATDGENFVNACRSGGSASFRKVWTDGCESTHVYCGNGSPGSPVIKTNKGVKYLYSVVNQPYNMKVEWIDAEGRYKIHEVKSGLGGCCRVDHNDCHEGTCVGGQCALVLVVNEEGGGDVATGGPESVAGSGCGCGEVGDYCYLENNDCGGDTICVTRPECVNAVCTGFTHHCQVGVGRK